MLAEGTVDRDGSGREGGQAGRAPAGGQGATQAKRPARPVLPAARGPVSSRGSGIYSDKPEACSASARG